MKLSSKLMSLVTGFCFGFKPGMSIPTINGLRAASSQSDSYDDVRLASPSKCAGQKVALIMHTCATGPWGKSQWFSDEIKAVFGSFNCIEANTNPSEQALSLYDVIYVEGSGCCSSNSWPTVATWLSTNGGRVILENLANAGASIFINMQTNQGPNNVTLPFGPKLNHYALDNSQAALIVSKFWEVLDSSLLQDGYYRPTSNKIQGDSSQGISYISCSKIIDLPNGFETLVKGSFTDSVVKNNNILVKIYSNAGTPVLLGAVTPPKWLAPSQHSFNFWRNMLSILCVPEADKPWKAMKKPITANPSIATEQEATCIGPTATCIGPYGHPVVTMVFGVPTLTDNNRETSTSPVPVLGKLAFVSSYTGYAKGSCSGAVPAGLTRNYSSTPTLIRDSSTGTYTIKTKLDPLTIGTSLSFCVRVEMRLGTSSSVGYDIVSYEEFAVTITVNFDGTFRIASQTVLGYDESRSSATGTAIISLNAYRCDRNFNANSAGILMGQVIHLCIKDNNSYTAPAAPKKFTTATATSLQLFQDNPGTTNDITQVLVGSTANRAGLLLSTPTKNTDNTIMKFEILVTEEFYRVTPTSPNSVRITGSVTGLTTAPILRRLLVDEDSQEQMAGEEDGDFEVIIEPEGLKREVLSPTGIGLVIAGALAMIALTAAFVYCRRLGKKKQDPANVCTSKESQEQLDL